MTARTWTLMSYRALSRSHRATRRGPRRGAGRYLVRLGCVLAIGPGRIGGVFQFGASHEYQYRLELDYIAFRAARLHDGPERSKGGIRL